jgi:hypothetical protein
VIVEAVVIVESKALTSRSASGFSEKLGLHVFWKQAEGLIIYSLNKLGYPRCTNE